MRDFKRIGHATRVARYAEEIVKKEKGEPAIVLSAAYLHDIGIREAEAKHQSTDRGYQYLEGPPVAREILIRLGAREDLIEEVCDIIGHHHPRPQESVNFKVVYDADRIVNLEEEQKETPMVTESLSTVIERSFLTESGREIARRVLLNPDKETESNMSP
jgi:HD superfamily phosphodiesterase